MKTFIMMSRLCPHGPSLVEVAARVKNGEKVGRAWVDQVKQLCPEAKFVAHFALLGPYDFMDIYEAPDEQVAAKVAMIGSARGAFQVETWMALADARLVELAREVHGAAKAE
ncbi:MAG: GYD domain-containing protein [Candidatus Zixiibacteriota bacterium]